MFVKILFSVLISFSFVQARDCEVTKLNGCCCEASRDLNDKPQDEFVAFTAITTNGNALTNDPIKYDNIVTNVGKAYSSTSGIFRAPIIGVYSISFSLMGHNTNSIWARLYHNGKEIVRLYTKGETRHEVTSHTVYLKLVKGDEVWVQGTAGKKLWAVEPYNQFSGALVRSGDFTS
ncbi:complement C1q tumor necrosis factor-related protein 3-like [Mytilus edulis]|uniref:complement C1q tumor necrosis factor-related protein 3-like n=1 Tax=Mytilus edulis TaxID=6550 RepID=UPI0039EF2469